MSYELNKSNNYYWWKDSEKEKHKVIFEYIQYLDQNQQYRQTDNIRFMRLYGNYPDSAFNMYNYSRAESSTYNIQNRVTLNVIQNMIDTVTSKITKTKPKPMFLTDGGTYKMQTRAKKLNKFCEGQFSSTKFYEKAASAFVDSCVFGTGAIKIFTDSEEKSVKCERVFIDEIVIDDREALYGEPRQIHQKKFIHRDVLKEMFPKFSGQINVAGTLPNSPKLATTEAARGDMVLVIESWHLPSGTNATDGKRVICIENATLLEEEYTKSHFPFVFFKWGRRPVGFFGQGLAEQLQGIQLEINKILKTIQVSMHLVSIPKILLEAGSKVNTAHLNNKIGGIITYSGTKPEYTPLGNIPPELFNHLDRLYNRAYEISGISQLSAQSQKPTGLDSGKALRTFNDLETERFMDVATRYEKSFLEAAEIMIDQAKDLYQEDENLSVMVKGDEFLETIKWKDIDLEEDKYLMTLFPTSALSNSPSGRLAEVQELLQAGFISKEDGLKLLDFPDLKSFYDIANASAKNIDKIIELMVEDSKYTNPEPYQNLEYGIARVQEAYLHYKNMDLEDSKLELLRRWMEDADALRNQTMQALQQQQMVQAPQEAPIGQPAAQPESDLLPVVPEGTPAVE